MARNETRRNFLRTATTLALAAPFSKTVLAAVTQNVKPKKISLQLNVRDFNALGDGLTNDTIALQRTIDRCAVLGGGEVLLPAGTYRTGALQLRSHVLLRLDKDATILGSDDMDDYPVTEVRWEGKWIPGHTGLLYAIDAEHTGIVGHGKLIGANLGGRPTKEAPLRHPAIIELIRCRHLRFEDFSTSYARSWSIHPTECTDLLFRNLTIRSTGGNGDGIDVDSCKRVHIDHCDIATGDDCISLKSGRGEEGYSIGMPTEDVTITHCTFADSIFACIGIGSETSAGIRRVHIADCKFTAAKTFALYIKSRPGRGPFLEDLTATNLEVSGTIGGFLRINLLNSGLQDQDPVPGAIGIPSVKNIRITNVKVTDCPVLVDATSVHPKKPIDGFTLQNITGTCAQGISLANMRNVRLANIHVTGYTGPLLQTHNVHGTGLTRAIEIKAPKLPDAVVSPATPYKLH